MASQLNSRPPTNAQGSPYCADPGCESCRELREMQERIRSENMVPQMNAETAGKDASRPALPVMFPANGSRQRHEN